MTKIIAVSGDGIGAGKTTYAKRMSDEVRSMAGALRKELKWLYPDYDWFNKTQEYKSRPFRGDLRVAFGDEVDEWGKGILTVRDMMVQYGQFKCRDDQAYWPRIFVGDLEDRFKILDGVKVIGIDDVRKTVEIEHLRSKYGDKLIHCHMDTGSALREPQFENEELRRRADYIIKWER